jgi:hypothetical protein
MISKLLVRTGFPLKLELFNKEIEFTPGLNILFGPNGCGKTTALNIVGAYSGVREKGWSQPPEPQISGKEEEGFPQRFSKQCVGTVKADVEWDGTPSYFSTSTGEVVVPHAFDDDDMAGQLQVMFAKPSSGQLRLHNIAKLMDAMTKKPVPDLTVADTVGVNGVWAKARQDFADYVKTLPRNGPITLLLDEPDRSLSIPVQCDLWTVAVPQWATRAQVIVAAHSPFCLAAPGANIIDCVSGYREHCLDALKTSFGSL